VALRVVLEVAPKRSFATALDWPGWSRAGRTPDEAVAALIDYAPRYAAVARRALVEFSAPASPDEIEVVERLKGGGTTEFGVPGTAASAEGDDPRPQELDRLIMLLEAAWATFDASARRAEGVELATGPRGGGRDLRKIAAHVRDAEVAYLGQLGSRPPSPRTDDVALLRKAVVATIRARVAGEPVANPRNTRRPWSVRYAIRRSAWHALDHAWEIEDRAQRH
jgi:hypothetical protein